MNDELDPLTGTKIITDDLIDIFEQNDQEILNFVGVTNDVEEYELHFTKSAEILKWDTIEYGDEGEEEQYAAEYEHFDDEDRERALTQIQEAEAVIAADINKYLKALKSKESLEFEQISRQEIFERIKCKCFEWNRIKNRETIKDVIKQICKAKSCKREIERKEQEEKYQLEHGKEKRDRYAEKKKKQIGVCSKKRKSIKLKKKRKLTQKELQRYTLDKKKLSREIIKSDIKKFAAISKSCDSKLVDESSSSDDISKTSTSSGKKPKQFLRAIDSILLKRDDEISLSKSLRSPTESATSTLSKNIQHLDSIEKIGKRKIHPKMFSMYLNEFNCIKNFAFVFIDNIVQEAEQKANVAIIDPLQIDINNYICLEYFCGKEEVQPAPSISEDTVSLYSHVYGYDLTPYEGETMVRDIIKYWKVRKTWKHCINFLGQQTDTCSNYYKFEVKWSEPTFSYPVPQVTASVFFTIELSRVKPTLFPPKVTFVFEGEKYKFTSYDDIKHEKFLNEIIYCKTEFFKSMRF